MKVEELVFEGLKINPQAAIYVSAFKDQGMWHLDRSCVPEETTIHPQMIKLRWALKTLCPRCNERGKISIIEADQPVEAIVETYRKAEKHLQGLAENPLADKLEAYTLLTKPSWELYDKTEREGEKYERLYRQLGWEKNTQKLRARARKKIVEQAKTLDDLSLRKTFASTCANAYIKTGAACLEGLLTEMRETLAQKLSQTSTACLVVPRKRATLGEREEALLSIYGTKEWAIMPIAVGELMNNCEKIELEDESLQTIETTLTLYQDGSAYSKLSEAYKTARAIESWQ